MARVKVQIEIGSDDEFDKVYQALRAAGLTYRKDDGSLDLDAPGAPDPVEEDPRGREPEEEETPKKKRGRPKGSKNKEKDPEPEKSDPVSDKDLRAAMKAYKSANGPDSLKILLEKFGKDRASNLSPEERVQFVAAMGLA